MTSSPKDDPSETPMQRALRLKKAAIDSKPKTPGAKFNPTRNAGMTAGASKPWMKR